MDLYERIKKTLDHIETHLTEELSLDELAQIACFSKFHYHRLFVALIGETVMDYIRKRRLTLAAKEIVQTKRKIIEIAFDYQFNSQENFTRAFKKYFGITPGECRKTKPEITLDNRGMLLRSIYLHVQGGTFMEPKIISRDEFNVVGMEIITTLKENQQQQTIPQLWGRFIPRCKEIKDGNNPHVAYGLCFGTEPDKEFSYVAGVEVSSLDDVPEGMVSRTIPASKYAVFTHKGPFKNLGETYTYIYGTWIPKSGHQLYQPFDFEYYDERSTYPDGPNTEVDIYIPIK